MLVLLASVVDLGLWLEVARECGCATPAECSLFPVPGDDAPADGFALSVVEIAGRDCRRQR